MANGPIKGSDLDIETSITGDERLIAVATVDNSLRTVTIPISTINQYTPPSLEGLSDVSITSKNDDDVIAWSSAADAFIAKNFTIAFASLASVSISNLQDGQYLVFDGSSGKWNNTDPTFITSASVLTALDPYITSASAYAAFASINYTLTLGSLSNVSVCATPTSANVLAWSSAQSKWVAGSPTAGILAIASASDVSVSSASQGQFLRVAADGKFQNETVDVVTSASLDTLLGSYITSSSLATALSPYLTSSSASAQYASVGVIGNALLRDLANVTVSSAVDGQFIVFNSVTQEFENRTIDYLTSASIISLGYITSASASTMVASQLAPYITSASVETRLGNYLTSASAAATYTTSALVSTQVSAALVPYLLAQTASVTYTTSAIVSTQITTRLGPYLTSASLVTALGPYITSASVVSAFAPVAEVGTWTPALVGSTSAGSATYNSQVGNYAKNGPVVHIDFTIVVSGAISGASGTANITGLPFSSKTTSHSTGVPTIVANVSVTAGGTLLFHLTSNNNTLVIRTATNNGDSNTGISSFGTGPTIRGSLTFLTSS